MGPLDLLRQSLVRLNPSQLSRPQRAEFNDINKALLKENKRAEADELRWTAKAAEAWNDEQRAKFLKAAQDAHYRASRFGKMEQASKSIHAAQLPFSEDTDLRAYILKGEQGELPRGLATFYQPGHYTGDPQVGDASFLELLGTRPDAPGAGRVLLRAVGLDSPSNPMWWFSSSEPQTMGFYRSRGALEVPRSEIKRGSPLWSDYDTPVFRVPRGDMIKERKGGLVRLAGGGAIKKGIVDPIAQAVAARMTGQLQGAGELLGLKNINLPAAYAGDQRSLGALTRALNEQETGLASPGRRKMLKQGAAMAARSAVPDIVANTLGTTALKKAVQDAVLPQEIPLESLQAAVAQAFEAALKARVPRGLEHLRLTDMPSWVANDKPHRTVEEMLALPNAELRNLIPELYSVKTPDKELRAWLDVYQQLSPESIAAKTGLPVEALREHLGKGSLQELLDDWRSGQEILENFYESSGRSQFRDFGFDAFPESTTPEELDSAIRAIHEDGDYDPLYALYDLHHTKAPYDERLFGSNLDRLEKVPGNHISPRMSQQEKLNNASDAFWDSVAEMFYELENQP